ncbi:hypothetical protein QBC44DRAFT_145607 [Cladorrhinum sp. PSN332]|nr:hypothetical protein QBC44DRAFT_145607 [Cladorrhinum sp. PSN332]
MRETRIDDKWAPSALPVSRSVPVRHKAEPRTSKSTAKDSGFFEADAGLEESKEMYDREEPDSTSALRKSQSEGTISKKPPALRKSVSSQGQLERHGNYRSSSASLRLKQSQQQLDPIFESRQHTTAPSTPISRPRSPLLPQAPLAVSRQSSSKLLQSVERLGDEQQDEKELVKVPSRLLLEIVEHLQNHEQRQETELRRQPSHLCNNAEPNEEEEQYESEEQPEGKQLNSDGQWGQRELALRLASRLLKTNEQIERERQLKRRKEPESQAQLRERESAYRSPLFLSESEEKAAQRLEGLVASEEKRDQWLSHLLAEEMRFMSRRRAQWVLQKFESEELLRDDFAGEKKRAKWLLWLLEGKGQDLDVERNMNGEERKDMAVVGKCLHHYFKEERERERKQAAMTNDEEQQRHDRRELGRRSSNQTVEEQETRRPTRSNSLRELSDRQRKPHRSKSTETYHHRSSREALRHDEGPSDAFDSQQTETYYPKSYAPGSTSVSMRRPSLELEYKRTGKITKTPPPTEGWIQPPNTTSRHILTRKKSFPSHRDATTQHREYYSHSPPPPPPSDLLSSVESTIKSLVLPPDPPRGR